MGILSALLCREKTRTISHENTVIRFFNIFSRTLVDIHIGYANNKNEQKQNKTKNNFFLQKIFLLFFCIVLSFRSSFVVFESLSLYSIYSDPILTEFRKFLNNLIS